MTLYVLGALIGLFVVQAVRFVRAWRRGARDGRDDAERDIALFLLGDGNDLGELWDRAWQEMVVLSGFRPEHFTSLAVAEDYARRRTRWTLVYRFCGARMVFVP